MQTQKPKELSDDLAYLEILLEKILELVEKGDLELKAADALKIIELKHKLFQKEPAGDDARQVLLDMLEQASHSACEAKEEGRREE